MHRIQPLASPWDPRRLRRGHPLEEPLPATFRWVASLPADVRPLALLRQFPRIANSLARARRHPSSWSAYMDELLNDRRGGRRGFPLTIYTELHALHEYFQGRDPGSR
jgi:hypothetical protein